MSKRKDGGSAFPLEVNTSSDGYVNAGMSLRDWFAGQALASMATKYDAVENIAADAYAFADAMLAEREKAR